MKQLLKWFTITSVLGIIIIIAGCASPSHSTSSQSETIEQSRLEESSTSNDRHVRTLAEERFIVQTEYGLVKGSKQDGVLIWHNLPYAAETAGEKRWTEPVDPVSWNDVRDATQRGAVALQQNGSEVIGTESPQHLSIYRSNSSTEKLPVFVYVHGGDNVRSSGAELSGINFVQKHDAIVVTINYRIGVLGFNPLQALKTGTPEENAGNFALLDIHKALIWVQNNIDEFGGDATNVTVAGFASGGRNVMAMLISPMFDGTFDRAVVFNGGMTLADERESQERFAQAFAPLVVEDGLQPDQETAYRWLLSRDPAVKTFFYQLSNERLVSVMNDPQMRMDDFPHLYQDGLVIPKTGFDTRRYNAVPLLLVTATNEFSQMAHRDPYFAPHVETGAIYHEPTIVGHYQFANYHAGQLYRWFNIYEPAQLLHDKYRSDIYTLEVQFGSKTAIVGEPLGHYGAFQGNVLTLLDPQTLRWQDVVGESYQQAGAKELASVFQQVLFEFMMKGNPNDASLPNWEKWSTEYLNHSLVLNANETRFEAEVLPALTSDQMLLQQIAEDNGIDASAKETILTQVLKGRWFSKQLDKIYSPIAMQATVARSFLASLEVTAPPLEPLNPTLQHSDPPPPFNKPVEEVTADSSETETSEHSAGSEATISSSSNEEHSQTDSASDSQSIEASTSLSSE